VLFAAAAVLLSGVLLGGAVSSLPLSSGGGGYMTATAPLVPGQWEGVCQDDGTGDWRAGNDHGRRCNYLNSQRHSPERD